MPTKMSGMEFWRLDFHIHLDVKGKSSGRWEAQSTWWRPWWMPVSSPGGCWGGGESPKSHLKVRGSKCFCPGTEHIWPSHRCGMQDVSYGMQNTGVCHRHQLIAKIIATIDVKIILIRDTFIKKLRDYLGIFPNIGGGGSPQSQNFCDLTK